MMGNNVCRIFNSFIGVAAADMLVCLYVGGFFLRERFFLNYAGMAELADAPDLGSGVHDVQVQVLLPAVNECSCKSMESILQLFFYARNLLKYFLK